MSDALLLMDESVAETRGSIERGDGIDGHHGEWRPMADDSKDREELQAS